VRCAASSAGLGRPGDAEQAWAVCVCACVRLCASVRTRPGACVCVCVGRLAARSLARKGTRRSAMETNRRRSTATSRRAQAAEGGRPSERAARSDFASGRPPNPCSRPPAIGRRRPAKEVDLRQAAGLSFRRRRRSPCPSSLDDTRKPCSSLRPNDASLWPLLSASDDDDESARHGGALRVSAPPARRPPPPHQAGRPRWTSALDWQQKSPFRSGQTRLA
jgi:hypothetical protein